MDNFLRLENRHNGEILRMHRRHDAEGRIVLFLDGTLPPKADGPPLHVHVREREEGIVKAGTLGARVGGKRSSCQLVALSSCPQAFVITGGTRATICWSLAATQFQL